MCNFSRAALSFPAALIPATALAKTAAPPAFWVFVASLAFVIPGVAFVLNLLVFISWCRGRVAGYWVLAGLAAAGIGGVALWLVLDRPRPLLDEDTWPLIYLALLPVVAVWFASRRSRARVVDVDAVPR